MHALMLIALIIIPFVFAVCAYPVLSMMVTTVFPSRLAAFIDLNLIHLIALALLVPLTRLLLRKRTIYLVCDGLGLDKARLVAGFMSTLGILALTSFIFADAKAAMQEMCRVLKTGGKLVIVDMAARQERLRETADGYERLRDPSHVKCLSETEFEALAACCGVVKDFTYLTRIPVKLSAWLDLTGVRGDTRDKIVSAMKDDIAGITQTGFEPYKQDNEIMFDHRWFLYIGKNKK